MAVPTPTKGETKKEFIARCMADAEARKSFPDQDQQAAFCYSSWSRGKNKANAMPVKRRLIGIRAYASKDHRTETLFGKEYTVVPVIALVEGVITGKAAGGPELALAEEFGRFPAGWNGRPLVMDHPEDNGVPISANSPGVLTDYQIGTIYNAKMLDGKKLYVEAWVENKRADSLNANSKAILSNLSTGKMVEVSTGYFAQLDEAPGNFNGEEYMAIQRNIVPDHLAMLPEGVQGACSIADGCGAPRINSDGTARDPQSIIFTQCVGCKDEPFANITNEDTRHLEVMKSIFADSIPEGMLSRDAQMLIQKKLRVNEPYTYVLGITSNKVVFEQYDPSTGSFATFQQTYTVNSDGSVELSSDRQEVVLTTNILPIVNAHSQPSEGGTPEEKLETSNMDKKDETKTAPAANAQPAEGASAPAAAPVEPVQPKTFKGSNEQGDLEVVINDKGDVEFKFTPKAAPAANTEQPKTHTLKDLLANAEPELRETISSAMKLHAEKKAGLIESLLKTQRCKFNKEQLGSMEMEMLENLAELAQVPTYQGVALPEANSDDNAAPPAPIVFTVHQGGQDKKTDAA